jgi:RNA polymerase sigma-70 factor, ECF subfamily
MSQTASIETLNFSFQCPSNNRIKTDTTVGMAEPFSPDRWLEDHGDALYGFAYVRVRDRDAAEDLVQETLLAAWRSRENFAANSAERTWLTGILKHKLADHWRRSARQPSEPLEADIADELIERTFDMTKGGRWRVAPSAWNNPDAALEQQQFWQVLAECVDALPPAQAQAFTLCELDGIKGDEACKVMEIAATNLWVMLHRARLRLRQCLEDNWFGRGSPG